MKVARFFSALVVAGAVMVLPALAYSGAPHRTIAKPLNVTGCNPQHGTYMATGFTPAYYPVGAPYWGWPAVYGPAYTYYQYPVQGNATLGIDYSNNTDIVMKKIEFGLVAKGNLVAEVQDVGTFSPGAEIKHEFGISRNVFPLGTGLAQCVPLKITFADGTHWTNPHLPALRRNLYRHP